MKLIRGNWHGKPGHWKIKKLQNSFRCNEYLWVSSDIISFAGREVHIGNEHYYNQYQLWMNTEKAFRRFIKRHVIPVEHTIPKGTIIELVGRYVNQQNLYYITK